MIWNLLKKVIAVIVVELGVELSTLSTDAVSQLDVLGHDGDTLGVDGAQVGVLEQTTLQPMSSDFFSPFFHSPHPTRKVSSYLNYECTFESFSPPERQQFGVCFP